MFVDILFSILILFIGIAGSRKGFLDEISEFIGIGLAIWLAMSFYVDLTIKLHSFININMELIQFFSAIIISIYFSFILLIGFNPEVLIKNINNSSLTFGVIFGLSIILISIALTFIYTLISNIYLDKLRDS